MKLAIGYWTNGNQSFVLSRATDLTDMEQIRDMLNLEAQECTENLDTILLLRNGRGASIQDPPEVIQHWSALEGDFDDEERG